MLLAAGLVGHNNRYHSFAPVVPDTDLSQQIANNGAQQTEQSADLKAQQSMALAAWAAVGVSVCGLVGLFFTVRYALFAWKAAEKSANADNEALILTRTQLDEARAFNMAQTRAWLSVQDLTVTNFYVGGKPRFEFLIRNSGNTPAYEVRYIAQVFLSDPASKPKIRFSNTDWLSKMIIAPAYANTGYVGGTIEMSQSIYDGIMSKNIVPVLAGYIIYRDVFKKRRFVTFQAYLDPEHMGDGIGFLTLAEKHNHAN
ncbi:hypothetical protein K1X12_12750 [Hyphomonas sp. WL0036]|uniref:hypothetical protein n=1 Tax=Hyphomonas sediminis TaxID=2866160 RepID=UPI001C7FA195|nr:hypothetical protein [Hyphomonas sediminis]MBY9067773.1 hypothetical protein [Hyphomonas sediminis]